MRVSIRTCVPNLGTVRRERCLTIDNPLNPPGVGWVKFCLGETIYPHMRAKFGRGAVRRPCRKKARLNVRTNAHTHVYERTTSNNPLNPHGVGWVNFFFKMRVSIRTCVPNFCADRQPCRKKVSFKFISRLSKNSLSSNVRGLCNTPSGHLHKTRRDR